MRSFLAVAPEKQEGCIILLREEFQARGVFEGTNVVLLGKPNGEGAFQRVDVGEEILDEAGAGLPLEKEDHLGILMCKRFSLGKRSFRPRSLGLSVRDIQSDWRYEYERISSLHLSQHFDGSTDGRAERVKQSDGKI